MSNFVSSTVTEPVCTLCDKRDNVTLRFQKNGYYIYGCKECELMFVSPQPAPDDLARIYDSGYFKRGKKYTGIENSAKPNPNKDNDLRKLSLVRKYKKEGSLLDVGCAMGGFLCAARDAGYDVSGVEISEFSAQYAKKNFGLNITTGTLISSDFSENSFDIITMWDVIEHLDELNPTLLQANRLLKPGGVIFMSTGDSGSFYARITGKFWHLLTPPQHLYYFTRKSLSKTLEQNGFNVEEITYPGKQASLGFIFFKAQEAFGPIISPFRKLIHILKLDTRQLYVNIYDIMTCVARKT